MVRKGLGTPSASDCRNPFGDKKAWGLFLQTAGIAFSLLLLALLYAWLYGVLGPREIPSIQRRFTMYPGIFAVYLVAVGMVCRGRVFSRGARFPLFLILLGAALLRIIILFGAVPRNPDLGRYLWEGKVLLAGFNPYAAPPGESLYDPLRAQLEAQGDELYSGMWTNYEGIRSVYGPVATVLFTIPHLLPFDRCLTLRVLVTCFDFLTVLLLVGMARALGRPEALVITYAWSPVCLNGFADRGQIDAVMVFLVVLAVRLVLQHRSALAGMAFGGAILTKISPLLLLGPLWCWGRWRLGGAFAATVLAGLLPFAGAGWAGFQGWIAFADHWQQNDSVFSLVQGALNPLATWVNPSRLARILVSGAALTYTVLRSRRLRPGDAEELIESLVWISAAVILLSPITFPWYTTSMLAFLSFRIRPSLLMLSAVPMLWYLNFLSAPAGSRWEIVEAALERWRQPWRLPAYGGVLLLFLGERFGGKWRRRRLPSLVPREEEGS